MTNDEQSNLARRTVLGMAGVGVLGLGGVSASAADNRQDETETETQTETGTATEDGGNTREEVEEIIADWEDKQREETMKTMEEYGVPDGVTERRLIWYDVDPWRRIEIFRDATQHNFPTQHPDFFEQFIDYQVPPEKADELMAYDGSIMFERTTGVMSARCHTEWANFLALNLANDIVTDEKSVEEARRAYAEDVIRKMNGESPEYTQGLQFELPEGNQRDPDVAIIEDGEVVMDQATATTTDGGGDQDTTAEDGGMDQTTTTEEGA